VYLVSQKSPFSQQEDYSTQVIVPLVLEAEIAMPVKLVITVGIAIQEEAAESVLRDQS